MKALEIINAYLKEHGYDGLYREDECACLVDDLGPCIGNFSEDCHAGYKSPCDPEECGEGHVFHIGEKKEVPRT